MGLRENPKYDNWDGFWVEKMPLEVTKQERREEDEEWRQEAPANSGHSTGAFWLLYPHTFAQHTRTLNYFVNMERSLQNKLTMLLHYGKVISGYKQFSQ